MEPGDALIVYGGRDHWDQVNPIWGSDPRGRPGLHASCLKFIRQSDCCLLVWDMMDFMPNGYDIPWSVHGAIFAYGIGLLDNALLQPLAEVCAEEGRYNSCHRCPLTRRWRHRLTGEPDCHVLMIGSAPDTLTQTLSGRGARVWRNHP